MLARIVESSLDGILAFDRDLRYTLWNAGMERISGLSRDRVLGRRAPDAFPFIVETGEEAYFRAALEGRTVRSENRAYRVPETGHEGWFEGHYAPVHDERGEVVGGMAIVRDVTERKRAEEARRMLEIHERSTRILESITDAFFSLDRAWRFTYLNASAERLLLRQRGELLGRNVWEEFPAARELAFYPKYHEVMEQRQPASFEEFYPAPLNRWYEVHAYPSEEGLSVYFRDVTERRQSEERLRRSEVRFQKLVEQSPLSTQIYAPDGTPLISNRAWERLFGVTMADIVGYNVLRDPELEKHGVMDLIRRGFAGEPVVIPEIPYRPYTGIYQGQERWCGAVMYPVKDEAGRVEHVILVHEDVTERRAAAERLRATAERLRLALEGSRMGDWYWDARTDSMQLSERTREIYGVPPGVSVTRTQMRERLHPEDRERARLASERAVAEQETYDVEYRVVKGDGSVTWVAARGVAQYDADGRATGMLGVVVDISARKRVEEERHRLLESEQAARAEAERASQMKDEFLATLSHELRTPLNAILGYAQLLRGGMVDSGEVGDALEVIERNARVQTQIIEDLLDMSRIVSGKLRLEVEAVNVAEVVEAAVRTVTPAADAKGIRVTRVLDSSAGGVVAGDAGRLQQVFWNLLTNAIKFTPKGGRVQVVLGRSGSQVNVTISDTGAGITPEFLPHVFERFRQADATTTRRHGGLGLGLAIVKHLVEMHGGTVRAASEGPGRGSTFVVAFPVSLMKVEGIEEGSSADARGGKRLADLAGVKVLVVDDERDARELVRRLLEECGAEVLAVGSAGEAVEVVRRERPAVLLSDIGMPEQDGYQLLRAVRGLGAGQGGDVPAAALTAFARSEDRTRAILAGFQMYLAKPLEPAELVAVVASLAGRTGGMGGG